MLPPLFPVYIPTLVPLHGMATLIWLAGIVCLWLTRYTHQLGQRLGASYYLFSAIVRPLGIALITVGWLALYAPPGPAFLAQRLGWLPRGDWLDILLWLGMTAFFALGLWSVAALLSVLRLERPALSCSQWVVQRRTSQEGVQWRSR